MSIKLIILGTGMGAIDVNPYSDHPISLRNLIRFKMPPYMKRHLSKMVEKERAKPENNKDDMDIILAAAVNVNFVSDLDYLVRDNNCVLFAWQYRFYESKDKTADVSVLL